jgi:toxin ParE1/3/4
MALGILWTERAITHLEAELEYYGKIHAKLARELAQLVNEAVEKIADFPGAGRSGKYLGTREFVLSQYPHIIAYRERSAVLEILAFIHQKRKNIQSYY